MKKQLVYSKDGSIYLDTGMSQPAFSKARLIEHIGERGIKAEQTGDGSWQFDKWSFTGTSLPHQTILLEGALFSGLPLSAFFESGNREKEYLAGSRVCSAIEEAIRQKIQLPETGGGGIFISADFSRILFLPQELFASAASCSDKETNALAQGAYINKVLSGIESERFTQAAVAYRLLTGEMPFNEIDEEKREDDYRDKNYIPLKNRIWGLDAGLAAAVDNALEAKATEGKFPLVALYKELGLTDEGEIPSDGNLLEVIRKSDISHERFDEIAARRNKVFQSILHKKRWIRAHRTLITVACVTVFILALAAASGISTSKTRPTTQGLTESETVEMFYSAFNNMDVVAASSCATGKDANGITEALSAYFVTAKQRSTYDYGFRALSPAEWLSFNNGGKFTMYGITQFYIGNKKGETYFKAAEKKDAPPPVTRSGGITLKKGDTKQLETSYYFVYGAGSEIGGRESIEAVKKSDTVTLTYKGNKWIITNIAQKDEETTIIDKESFYNDYKQAFESNAQDAVKAADELRDRYKWLPLSSEIIAAQEKIKKDNE